MFVNIIKLPFNKCSLKNKLHRGQLYTSYKSSFCRQSLQIWLFLFLFLFFWALIPYVGEQKQVRKAQPSAVLILLSVLVQEPNLRCVFYCMQNNRAKRETRGSKLRWRCEHQHRGSMGNVYQIQSPITQKQKQNLRIFKREINVYGTDVWDVWIFAYFHQRRGNRSL